MYMLLAPLVLRVGCKYVSLKKTEAKSSVSNLHI